MFSSIFKSESFATISVISSSSYAFGSDPCVADCMQLTHSQCILPQQSGVSIRIC